MDGTISVCQVVPDGQVLKTLLGHKKGVTDCQWSAANDFILSTSLDKTIRIWNVKTGACLRSIVDIAEDLCCLFHPQNNNIFVVDDLFSSLFYFIFLRCPQGALISCQFFRSETEKTKWRPLIWAPGKHHPKAWPKSVRRWRPWPLMLAVSTCMLEMTRFVVVVVVVV